MSTTAQFLSLLNTHGSDVVYHRDDSTTPCPCRTPEGFRDPAWHVAHPSAPVCNAQGMLPNPTELTVKAFVQPAQSTRSTRLTSEVLQEMFGTIRADDHIGIFPITWLGTTLDFTNWSQNGEDYIEYNSRRFFVVNVNKIPDPSDGNPNHHYECGLRKISG